MAVRAKYIQLDIEKPDLNEQDIVNISGFFQGRVGDKNASIDLQFMRNGRPLDLTLYTVGFAGIDPNGNRMNTIGYARYDRPGADIQKGKVNYYFPAGVFRTEGLWDTKSTYFYVTSNNEKVSTVNVYLNVLPNMVEMGINAEPFETDMDRVVTELKSYAESKKAVIDGIAPQLAQMQQTISAQKTEIDAYTKLIQDSQVPTTKQMEDYVQKLMQGVPFSGDLNLCLDPKHYVITKASSNNPSGEGVLDVMGNDDILVQTFVDNEENVWVRSRVAGIWKPWIEQTGWTE